MPKIMDLPEFGLTAPQGFIVYVKPYLFWHKKGNIQSHHDPKAKVLLKAVVYVTNGAFTLSHGYGSNSCRVDRRTVNIDLDDPNALSEFSNGKEAVAEMKRIMQEVTL